jgi:hypothetical protein
VGPGRRDGIGAGIAYPFLVNCGRCFELTGGLMPLTVGMSGSFRRVAESQ